MTSSTLPAEAQAFVGTHTSTSTRENYRSGMTAFCDWCASRGYTLMTIEGWHLDLFKSDLQAQGKKPSTVRNRQQIVSSFYSYMVKKKVIDSSPVPPRWVDRSSDGLDFSDTLSADEFDRFMAAADRIGGTAGLLVRLITDLGLRVGEIESANVEDVETLDSGATRLRTVGTRGGPKRERILRPGLAAQLREEVGTRTTGPLFTSQAGGRISQQVLQRILDRVARATGDRERVSPGVLRKSAMRRGMEAGQSPEAIAQQFYDNVRPRQLRGLDVYVGADYAEIRPYEFAQKLLSLADLLLEDPDVHPGSSVVLSSAALEYVLKQLDPSLEVSEPQVPRRQRGMTKIAGRLMSAEIISKLERDTIEHLASRMRNPTVHGDFSEITRTDARYFIDKLGEFIDHHRGELTS